MALPVYEMMINPDETSDVEVSFVALVDTPAIEKNFLAFNNQQLYFKTDEEKRIIAGPAMVADSLIYRRDQNGEYNVFFSKQTIQAIAIKFAKKGYAKNLNLFHDPGLPAEGVTIFNSFVSDKETGIPPMKGFEDLPDGSWFISAKVENDEIWQKIKAGEVRGFSVEGNFSFVQNEPGGSFEHLKERSLMSDIKTLLGEIKAMFMNPAPAPTPEPAPVAAAATVAKLKDGTEVSISEMAVGGVVMIGDAPAPMGEHELEDGTKIKVGEGGLIMEMEAPSAEPPAMDYTKEFSSINEKFAGYEQKFAAYEERFKKQEEAVSNANATIVKLVSIVEQLANTPTADPVPTGSNFNSNKGQEKKDKLTALMQNLQKLKN